LGWSITGKGIEMKEFKKWVREYTDGDEDIIGVSPTESAEGAWKAALEWVLEETDKNYYAFDSKFDVYNLIKDELKNE